MLEDILKLLNDKELFNKDGDVTTEGINTIDKLKEILMRCKQIGIIEKWNEDIVDKIENENI